MLQRSRETYWSSILRSALKLVSSSLFDSYSKLSCRVTVKLLKLRGESWFSPRPRVGLKAKRQHSARRRRIYSRSRHLTPDAVKLALLPSPTLGWLAVHEDTIAALTNLRTLGWAIKAGAALGSKAGGLASHTAIADRLWKYWTKDRADVQALMMRLAKREALFERSFALTGLEAADTMTFTQRPEELSLRLNERSNRIEFDHDLAADWARFQFLKQIWTNTSQWVALAGNPLWTNALRILGQFLLRQSTGAGTSVGPRHRGRRDRAERVGKRHSP